MEVIPLDDRINSTTILNTASPSDAPDVTNVYTTDDYDGNGNFNDAPILDDEDLPPPPAAGGVTAGGGLSRNKLLIGLIAGSALLCAMATGGGVAIRRARVNASRKCTVADLIGGPSIGALSPPGSGSKTSKSPKSSKSPGGTAPLVSTASFGTNKSTSTNKSAGGGGRRRLMENNYYLEGTGWTIGKGEEQQHGHHHRRRLQTTNKSSTTKSASLKSSNTLGLQVGSSKKSSSKKSSSGFPARDDILATEIPCKCIPTPKGEIIGPPGGGVALPGNLRPPPSTKGTNKSVKGSTSTIQGLEGGATKGTNKSVGPSGSGGRRNNRRRLQGPAGGTTTKSSTTKSASLKSSSTLGLNATGSNKSSSKKSSSSGFPARPGANLPIDIGKLPPECMPPSISELITKAPTGVKSPKSPPAAGLNPSPSGPSSTSTSTSSSEDTPPASEVTPPCEETDKGCGEEIPPIEEITPPGPSPTPGGGSGGENPPPTPGGGSGGENPPPSPSPNCDDDEEWSSDDGKDCGDVAKDPNVLCPTESSASGVFASTACPASCNLECRTNCDNDESWESDDNKDCDDVAADPIDLCGSAKGGGKSAVDACPASCNKECFVNCDNDPLWVTKDDETCEDVAADSGKLCEAKGVDKVKASIACPAACNPLCGGGEIITTTFPTIDFFPDIDPPKPDGPDIDIPVNFPTPSPKLDTYEPTPQVTQGASVTVGTEEEEKPEPPPDRLEPEPIVSLSPTSTFVTLSPTSIASNGGTVTVSTETTGPPTLANRQTSSPVA